VQLQSPPGAPRRMDQAHPGPTLANQQSLVGRSPLHAAKGERATSERRVNDRGVPCPARKITSHGLRRAEPFENAPVARRPGSRRLHSGNQAFDLKGTPVSR
jgi:hypothetical protein